MTPSGSVVAHGLESAFVLRGEAIFAKGLVAYGFRLEYGDVEVPEEPGPPPPTHTLRANETSGVVSAGAINMTASTTITLTGDLTLVANENIVIDGTINFPAASSSTFTLTIVSNNAGALLASMLKSIKTQIS